MWSLSKARPPHPLAALATSPRWGEVTRGAAAGCSSPLPCGERSAAKPPGEGEMSKRDSSDQYLPEHFPVAHQAVERLLERSRLVLLEHEVAEPRKTIAAHQSR